MKNIFTYLIIGALAFLALQQKCENHNQHQELERLQLENINKDQMMVNLSSEFNAKSLKLDSLEKEYKAISIKRSEVDAPRRVKYVTRIVENQEHKIAAEVLPIYRTLARVESERADSLSAVNDSLLYKLKELNFTKKEIRDSIWRSHENWPLVLHEVDSMGWYDIGAYVYPDSMHLDALFFNDFSIRGETQRYGFLNLRKRNVVYIKSLNPYSDTTVIPYVFKRR
jgi:hypothetical protein